MELYKKRIDAAEQRLKFSADKRRKEVKVMI